MVSESMCNLTEMLRYKHFVDITKAVARIDFGEVRDHQKVDLLGPKSGLFEPHPLCPSTKTSFWPTFWLKVDLSANLGWCVAPPAHPLAMGLGITIHR